MDWLGRQPCGVEQYGRGSAAQVCEQFCLCCGRKFPKQHAMNNAESPKSGNLRTLPIHERGCCAGVQVPGGRGHHMQGRRFNLRTIGNDVIGGYELNVHSVSWPLSCSAQFFLV